MSEKMIDLETIEKLADIIVARDLSEITVKDGDKTVTVKGRRNPPPPPQGAMGGMPFVPGTPAAAPAPAAAAAPAEPETVRAIKAPIVGTFYAAPSPESAPYVNVGDIVHKGDTVFIIESMKVMSEVQSDQDGIVKQILVKNGDPVEYDQPVIILE